MRYSAGRWSRPAADQIKALVDNSTGLIEALAASPTAVSLDAAAVRTMIVAAQQKNPQFELIFVMDTASCGRKPYRPALQAI